MIKEQFTLYYDEKIELQGYVSTYDKEAPLVIFCHSWNGKDEFTCNKAKEISDWGFNVFAIDVYGKDVVGQNPQQSAALKKPFIENRVYLQKRLQSGFDKARSFFPLNQIFIVGMGFGGLCALDIARTNSDVKGVVSIYGHFDNPIGVHTQQIKAKVLILHGEKDPIVPLTDLFAFQKELDRDKVDWESHIYGNTYHGFANPAANDISSGILYNPLAATRAWQEVKDFITASI